MVRNIRPQTIFQTTAHNISINVAKLQVE
uniref:Uncharacterized protein n=1 Tax=Anguilla anguilla TaxID=7936 RepID=A0A0E9UC24_ANGAN